MGRMTPVEARELLGLDKAAPDLTAEIVTAAYRRTMLACHPDTTDQVARNLAAGLDTGNVPRAIPMPATLQAAKKMLLDIISGQDNACRTCRGRGRVPYKVGTARCSACEGTGDRKP